MDVTLRVDAVDSVEMVKRQLQRQSGIPFDEQRLVFAGRELENHRSLAEYGVPRDAAMRLALPQRRDGQQNSRTGSAERSCTVHSAHVASSDVSLQCAAVHRVVRPSPASTSCAATVRPESTPISRSMCRSIR